ncbi:MAG: hypothetical protein P8Y58_13660 [Novosphingobium sp.]
MPAPKRDPRHCKNEQRRGDCLHREHAAHDQASGGEPGGGIAIAQAPAERKASEQIDCVRQAEEPSGGAGTDAEHFHAVRHEEWEGRDHSQRESGLAGHDRAAREHLPATRQRDRAIRCRFSFGAALRGKGQQHQDGNHRQECYDQIDFLWNDMLVDQEAHGRWSQDKRETRARLGQVQRLRQFTARQGFREIGVAGREGTAQEALETERHHEQRQRSREAGDQETDGQADLPAHQQGLAAPEPPRSAIFQPKGRSGLFRRRRVFFAGTTNCASNIARCEALAIVWP